MNVYIIYTVLLETEYLKTMPSTPNAYVEVP